MRTLFLLLLPIFSTAQPCVYLAYDGFDYPENAPLDDRNGGAGWAEPWLVQNDNVALPGYQINSGAGSLAFGNLQTLGHYATGGREYLTAGRRLATSDGGPFDDYVAEFSEGIGTQTGTTLWMSALIRKDQNNNQSVYTGLHGSDLPWCDNCTDQKVEFGFFEGHSEVGGQRRWTLRIGEAYYPTTEPVVIGETTFFAIKIQFLPIGNFIELYINPAELGSGSPAPVFTQSDLMLLVFRSVVAYLGNSPGNGALDEVRLGTTYACVAPDNTVVVDLPPVAVITPTTTDGQAPLSIDFSGADSYDPEGGPLSYTWSFGDGSPEVSGISASHTYTAIGNLTVRLTVSDTSGLQHTAQQVILVRDENGTFSCLSSFSLIQQANCTGNNGIIRINDHPENFTLRNAAGAELPATNGSEFHHLAPGAYSYTASGGGGCTDAFTLYVPVDSTTCPGWQPDLCDLAIGSNMSGFADWVPERPIRNLMKHVRPDFIAYDDPCFCWSNGNAAGIATDADGYPTGIPQTFNGVANKVRYVISSEGANLPPGHTYVLLYDGAGSLNVQGGATVTSNAPGRIQFNVTAAENLFFTITASQLGNHVRNVRVLRLDDEFADLEAQPFYPGFLEKIAPFRVLRFMDWGATNHNPVVHWEERTSVSNFTYATPQGVPYELMITLANQTQKDVWICVPHAADSNYVAQMATLFRNNLDPDLRIYLEYSNEVWNWIFDQAHYNVQTAPSNLNYGRAMAEKAGATFRIWHEVFGDEKSRVKRVLGLQAGFNYLNEQILSQLDPSDWDYGSPTSYIGLDHSDSGTPVLNAGSTPEDILENARNSWHDFIPALRQDYNNVKLFGKAIVNYEGGQHFVGNVFGIPYPYQQAMWDAQYNSGIYRLYDDMLDTIRSWGSRLFGNFSLSSPQESVYGSWGVLNDIDIQPPYLETAPKYQALLDNSCPDLPNDTSEPLDGLDSELVVYPNPSNGLFELMLIIPDQTNARVLVYDLLGRMVFSEKWMLQAGQNNLTMDLTKVVAGVYRVVVVAERQVWSAGVVIGRK
ncbi:MAG: PKD domain-containing protein [Saprospiraceae bacterium]